MNDPRKRCTATTQVNELKKLLAAQQSDGHGGMGGRAMSEEEKRALAEQSATFKEAVDERAEVHKIS